MNHRLHHTPVRDISINSRSVTGIVPSFGKYESTLERDFMEILRFDPSIEHFTPQPLKVEYRDNGGRLCSYTPDGLITFKPAWSSYAMPVLFEVKYRADFRKHWKELLPKFRAAKAYCLGKGWRFEVFTEREIRTAYLNNVKFLWPFRERSVAPELKTLILRTLGDLDEADPDFLLCALCSDSTNRARMIPVLWHLIATSAIGCDLTAPLTMRSRIWAEQESRT